jgi:hypothetical protein
MYHQLNNDATDPTDRPSNQQTVAQAILSAAERPHSLGMPRTGGPAVVTPTAMRPYPSYRAPSQSTMNPSAAAMPMSMAPNMNPTMPMPMPIPPPYMMEGYPPNHAHASSYPPYPYPAYPPQPGAYPTPYGAPLPPPVPAYSQVLLFLLCSSRFHSFNTLFFFL